MNSEPRDLLAALQASLNRARQDRLASPAPEAATERPEHEHSWRRRQNVTTNGYVMNAIEVCAATYCDAARQVDPRVHYPDSAPAVPADGARDAGRLSDDEREALFRAGDHHPQHCDCSAYVIEQAFAEDDCCVALNETFASVESILRDRLAEHDARVREQAAREAREALRADETLVERVAEAINNAFVANWDAPDDTLARAAVAAMFEDLS